MNNRIQLPTPANNNDGVDMVSGGTYLIPVSVLIGFGLSGKRRIGVLYEINHGVQCTIRDMHRTSEGILYLVTVYGSMKGLNKLQFAIELVQEHFAKQRATSLSKDGIHKFIAVR